MKSGFPYSANCAKTSSGHDSFPGGLKLEWLSRQARATRYAPDRKVFGATGVTERLQSPPHHPLRSLGNTVAFGSACNIPPPHVDWIPHSVEGKRFELFCLSRVFERDLSRPATAGSACSQRSNRGLSPVRWH
jgi:hypothetical protein